MLPAAIQTDLSRFLEATPIGAEVAICPTRSDFLAADFRFHALRPSDAKAKHILSAYQIDDFVADDMDEVLNRLLSRRQSSFALPLGLCEIYCPRGIEEGMTTVRFGRRIVMALSRLPGGKAMLAHKNS